MEGVGEGRRSLTLSNPVSVTKHVKLVPSDSVRLGVEVGLNMRLKNKPGIGEGGG